MRHGTSTQFLWVGRGWLFSEAAHVYRLLFLIWRWDRLSVETSHFLVNCHKNCSYQSILRFSCFSYYHAALFWIELRVAFILFVGISPKKQGWIFRKERYQISMWIWSWSTFLWLSNCQLWEVASWGYPYPDPWLHELKHENEDL